MDRFFEIVVNENKNALFGFLFSILRDRQQAEDLTQETFLVLYRKVDDLDVSKPILPWLLTTARNLAMNANRRNTLENRLFLRGDEALEFWADAGSHKKSTMDERIDALKECRKDLSDPQREVVSLFYGEGLKSSQIAERIGVTAEAVFNRLTRGRSALRQCIKDRLKVVQ